MTSSLHTMVSCKACSQPLVLQLDPDDFDEATSSVTGGSFSTVPDDLELPCSCHFHWQCLLDTSPMLAVTLACPFCSTPFITNSTGPSATNPFGSQTSRPQLLTRYTNEGGVQISLDILPLITEEAYLDSHPSARPARAFLTMSGEGDVSGIIELLQNLSQPADEDDEDEEEEERMAPAAVLRYQDPLDGDKSGLHVAVEKSQLEIVWLLLWVGSRLEEGLFPEEAVGQAALMGAGRELVIEGQDIRELRDKQGRRAGDLAVAKGGMWATMANAGVFGTWEV